MFLRIASHFIRQPVIMKQMTRQLTFLPMATILNNHKLLIHNLSQLRTEFLQIEEQNDDDDLLQKEVPVRRTISNYLN
ncbi:unnamed protein product (macronuclear) [Paramecium tetraurelia]|uniref:Uncharacterized protein n=1 Tax=Paramecium tetraurelia TaxID=5888 RepID=A0EGU3_PARTE|nr:uncharacterized protein GSPATT00026858001 [Paramecium tetraurelia]CAK94534.1 unnamed protein product [Paramecium tetraurelia]|eukprot:XP_001461907.1 hypothetical protein (macronuclear) [Paramecium tetraurelia strain d4-2]